MQWFSFQLIYSTLHNLNFQKPTEVCYHIYIPHKGDVVTDLVENKNEVQNYDRGDSISKEEFEKSLRGQIENKAGKAEKIILFELVCDTYETDDIPNDYKVNKTAAIPKKLGADKCEKERRRKTTIFASLDSSTYWRIKG